MKTLDKSRVGNGAPTATIGLRPAREARRRHGNPMATVHIFEASAEREYFGISAPRLEPSPDDSCSASSRSGEPIRVRTVQYAKASEIRGVDREPLDRADDVERVKVSGVAAPVLAVTFFSIHARCSRQSGQPLRRSRKELDRRS